MCRIAAYLGGPEVTLSSLTLEGNHSLLEQSYAPREMLSGVVNADGFGAGWYVPWAGKEPAVYRTEKPLWADGSFASIAPKTRSRTILAALRSATPGLPFGESGVPPFASGRYMLAHNGAIEGFRHTAMRPLREALSDGAYAGLLGATDSETVFAVLLDALDESEGDLAGALAQTVRRVSGVCEDLGVKVGLNLAATDGERMVFTRYSLGEPANSLYYAGDARRFPGGTVVASERLDGDEGWRTVPEGHLLVVGEKSGAYSRPL